MNGRPVQLKTVNKTSIRLVKGSKKKKEAAVMVEWRSTSPSRYRPRAISLICT